MSGASRARDPIEAAEAGIAGSKDLIAAVADDLSQHRRWLAHYRVAERRRTRRLMFQELMYRLEIGRQRLMRMLRRLAAISVRLAHTAAVVLSRTGAALLVVLRRVTIACAIWIRPRAYALARALLHAVLISFAWICLKGGDLARAALKAASVSLAWLMVRSRAVALVLQRRLAAVMASTGTRIEALSRASLATASAGFSWAAQSVRRVSLARAEAGQQRATNHGSLVGSQCTALACIEPRRAQLPAVRAG